MTPNLSDPLETQDGASRLGWTPLLDAMVQGVILVDAKGRYLEMNPAAAQSLGLDRETLQAYRLPDPWSNLSAADGSALAAEQFPGLVALRTGTPVRRKPIGWKRQDGSILWLEVSAEPLQGGGALVSFDDITEHREQSRNLQRLTELYAALSQVNQAIVWSPTKEALLNKICEVMVEFGKFAISWIGWNDPETHNVWVASKYGEKYGYFDNLQVRSDDTPLGRGPVGTAIREERTCVVNDFLGSSSASPWHGAAIRNGIAACAAIPIRKGGKVCGALAVYATEKDYFGVQEIKLLEEAAVDVTFAMDNYDIEAQRKQAEDALKESEYFFRESQKAAAIGSYVLDFTIGKWESSTVLDTIFGIDRDYDRSIQGWLDIIHLDDQAMMDQYLREEVIAGKRPFSKEYRICRKNDGATRWVNGLGGIEFDGDGNFLVMVGTIQDITERKLVEAMLLESQSRLKRAESVANFGHWQLNLDEQVVLASDGARGIYGLAGIEWSIQTVQKLPLPEYRSMLDRALANLVNNQQPYNVEFRINRAFDGQLRDIHSIAEYDPGRRVVFGVIHDITERKQVEATLRESEERYRTQFELSTEGILALSTTAKIIDVNESFARMHGYSRAELLKMKLQDLDTPESFKHSEERIRSILAREEPTFEVEHRHKDGHAFPLEVSAGVIPSGGENIILTYHRDITERKSAEKEKEKLQAQLMQAQKMESLGLLAGGIAHDMNNVLAAILGMASANIEDQPVESPAYHAFDTISTAAMRGGKMVKSLLNFARKNPVEEREIDLNGLLREEVDLLERTTLSRIRLELSLADNLRPILGDASALTHAFMNLCINAVDAIPDRGNITLRTRNVDNDWIEVVVEDTGTGMPKEVLEKATDPFFTTKAVGKGTGFGLSMVYSTVKAHRGELDIQSEPGQGTRVRMRFPSCETLAKVPGPMAKPRSNHCTRGFSVLLVDDDELIQSSMKGMLAVLGHRVTAALSGEEALGKVEAGFQPEVVILDMNMPGLGGAETLPRLRALLPEIPVLLSSGRIDRVAMALTEEYLGVTLLPKPFSMIDLQQQLEILGPG